MKNRTIAALLIPAIVLLLMPSLPAAADAATGTIKGTLIDSNGQAMVGYKVTVVDVSGVVHESAPTGADGKYEISGLVPGNYNWQILDPSGKIVPVRIPPVELKAGTAVTQPIAIVPKAGGTHGKGPMIACAWDGRRMARGPVVIRTSHSAASLLGDTAQAAADNTARQDLADKS